MNRGTLAAATTTPRTLVLNIGVFEKQKQTFSGHFISSSDLSGATFRCCSPACSRPRYKSEEKMERGEGRAGTSRGKRRSDGPEAGPASKRR